MMRLQQALAYLPEARLIGNAQSFFNRVHTDTRSVLPGDLFVALRGQHFDAHDFLQQAKAQGATCAIASHGLQAAGLSGFEVQDTHHALKQLAGNWRKDFNLPLIAITGSNGKTTVTQMVASILQNWQGSNAFATQGNLNNDIGVPLTLLKLQSHHCVGVLELGMNHPGEIAALADLVQPQVALVNNAQREHLEFMQTVEAVAIENGSVFSSLPADGTAVFPANDPFEAQWRKQAGNRQVLTFELNSTPNEAQALKPLADFSAIAKWVNHLAHWDVEVRTPDGTIGFSLAVPGLHNVKNALAACACAWSVGAPLGSIAAGLSAFLPVNGRSKSHQIRLSVNHCICLIDDSYNANPDSMQAAIELLAGLPGPRLLVMGDMGEVGSKGVEFHAEAGRLAQFLGIDYLYTAGLLAKAASTAFAQGVLTVKANEFASAIETQSNRHFDSLEQLNAEVLLLLNSKTSKNKYNNIENIQSVLVKGSRFMRCEQVVKAIIESAKI